MVELTPGELVLHEIYRIGYETPEKIEKGGKGYADKGVLKLTNTSLIFEGNKIQLRMKKVSTIIREDSPMKLGGGYVQVNFIGDDGKKKSALFTVASLAFWTRKKAVGNFYKTLIHWFKLEKKELQHMPRCPTCRQVAAYVQQYKKWYCTQCQTYL